VKIIGIMVANRDQGEFVLEALRTAVENERVTLEDMALVTNEDGNVEIHQTKDVTPGKGARRGTLIGAVVGLAAPPLLGAAAVGAGVGALWGKIRDRGVDDDLMKNIGSMVGSGESIVFALGDDASIAAVADRVRELTDGDMKTITIDTDSEALVREAADHVPEPPTGMPIRMPYS
jgi:uncharacterized membrane protein